MAQSDFVKRYLDAGATFTVLTQQRAESIVKEFVKTGELQAEQTQQTVQDLVDRSRKSTEKFLGTIRAEVRSQVANLGVATKADITRLEKRIDGLKTTAAPAKAAAKKAPVKKAPARKAAARKTPAKKVAARKAPARKAAARKTTGR